MKRIQELKITLLKYSVVFKYSVKVDIPISIIFFEYIMAQKVEFPAPTQQSSVRL